MFDPHRIGPSRSTSYWRNKGRVIQRKLVDPPARAMTRSELEDLYPLMERNGLIPPRPSTEFGRLVNYRVFADGIDISNNYVELAGGSASLELNTGYYLVLIPNNDISGLPNRQLVVRIFGASETGTYEIAPVTNGSRLYNMGSSSPSQRDYLLLTGENGTVIRINISTSGSEVAVGSTIATWQDNISFDM